MSDYNIVNQNIGAPSAFEVSKIAFQLSDKIMGYLKAQGMVHQLNGVNFCAYISEECEQIKSVGIREGLALAKCDSVCRALFGLD